MYPELFQSEIDHQFFFHRSIPRPFDDRRWLLGMTLFSPAPNFVYLHDQKSNNRPLTKVGGGPRNCYEYFLLIRRGHWALIIGKIDLKSKVKCVIDNNRLEIKCKIFSYHRDIEGKVHKRVTILTTTSSTATEIIQPLFVTTMITPLHVVHLNVTLPLWSPPTPLATLHRLQMWVSAIMTNNLLTGIQW